MAGDSSQVIAGRNMILYTAAYDPTNTFPDDTVAWGEDWDTPTGQAFPYVDKGYTRDGLRFRMNVPRTNVQVDQVVDPVIRIPTSRELNMETNLAQVSASNLQQSTGQPDDVAHMSSAAPSTTPGHEQLDILGTIIDAHITAGFDILNPGDLQPVRLIGWKGIVLAEIQMNFQVTEAAQITFNVGLVPDTGSGGHIYNPARLASFRDIIAPVA